jgi:hypothetical protein
MMSEASLSDRARCSESPRSSGVKADRLDAGGRGAEHGVAAPVAPRDQPVDVVGFGLPGRLEPEGWFRDHGRLELHVSVG